MESLAQTSPSPALPQQLPQGIPANSGLDLNDIHLPEQISEFPIALGWWIVAAIIILSVIYAAFKYRSHVKQRIKKQQAYKQMQLNPRIDETIKILKWAAMQYFPRSQLANLYGDKFQQFLSTKLTGNQQAKFDTLSIPAFSSLYQQNVDTNVNDELNKAGLLWLKNALPPNKKHVLGAKQ